MRICIPGRLCGSSFVISRQADIEKVNKEDTNNRNYTVFALAIEVASISSELGATKRSAISTALREGFRLQILIFHAEHVPADEV